MKPARTQINSVFAGQKFSPLTYTVIPAAVGDDVIQVTSEQPALDDEEGMSTFTLILIGIAVAALAGSGGGGGGSSAPTTGSVTITTDVPD